MPIGSCWPAATCITMPTTGTRQAQNQQNAGKKMAHSQPSEKKMHSSNRTRHIQKSRHPTQGNGLCGTTNFWLTHLFPRVRPVCARDDVNITLIFDHLTNSRLATTDDLRGNALTVRVAKFPNMGFLHKSSSPHAQNISITCIYCNSNTCLQI